ncbi:MAG: AAA family ATPase [Bdellovibrio sp.]|nr:AAA family ATPase [Bdellovibrio sp.]
MLSKELDKRLGKAIDLASKKNHEFVTLEHLVYCLIESPLVIEILEKLDVTVPDLKAELLKYIQKNPVVTDEQKTLATDGEIENWKPELAISVHRAFERAALQLHAAGKNQIHEGHVLISIFEEKKSMAVYCLEKFGVKQFDVISIVSHDLSSGPTDTASNANGSNGDEAGTPDKASKSALENFALNLNEYVQSGKKDPLVGRTDLIEKMIQTLGRRTKNNPLLIGDSGVGKTAIAEGLAEKIVAGDVPPFLKDKLIYSVDLGSILAGAKYRGDFESRLKNILKEVLERKNIILFIDEIHTIVGAGSTSGGSMDASNLLKPALTKGELTVIGATTFQEYRQHFEKDKALNRRFQRCDVSEPTAADTLEILKGIKSKYEQYHNVSYSAETIQACVDLSMKYLTQSKMPDKAIDLLDEVGSYKKLKFPTTDLTPIAIEPTDVMDVVSRLSGVPINDMNQNDLKDLKDLDKKLKSVVFGQDEAIDVLVRSIKFARSGLENKEKPWGSYLFAGPTGVGKTEVCKQLARLLGIQFHRFDMSEYMEKHAVSRLVGAPPGYVGYEQGGQLTEMVSKNPYSLILLDEIEKAHPDIYSILLQVMDGGRLTDGNGRTVNFKNTIVIMTSNAGAQDVAKGTIGLSHGDRTGVSQEAIKKTFAPEFINRLDQVVYFNSLTKALIENVVEKFLADLRLSLAEKHIELVYSHDVVSYLADVGFDPVYGARPISRKIDQLIKSQLVDEILFGKLKTGGKVEVSLSEQNNKKSLAFGFVSSPVVKKAAPTKAAKKEPAQ